MALSTARCGYDSQKFDAEWTIEGFSVVLERLECQSHVESPCLVTIGSYKFCIRLFPNGADPEVHEMEQMSVYFARKDTDHSIVNAKVRFECRTSGGRELAFKPTAKRYSQPGSLKHLGWIGFRTFAKVPDILAQLDDDVLNIRVTGECYYGSLQPRRQMAPLALDGTTLIRDMSALLASGQNTDVSLQLDDGTELKAHKVILSARSAVFDRMFASSMQEGRSNRVKLVDVDVDIAQMFLTYLYTGCLPGGPESSGSELQDGQLCSLLCAAHQFGINDLAAFCAGRVASMLTVENVAERLQMADLYELTELRQACMSFMTSSADILCEVQGTKGFQQLVSTPKLLAAILAETSGRARRTAMTTAMEFGDDTEWQRLNVPQLRRACNERQLISTGGRNALLQRLIAMESRTDDSGDSAQIEIPTVGFIGDRA